MQITLLLDEAATSAINALRIKYYPKHINKHPAHITLFYKLYIKDASIFQETMSNISISPFDITIDTINATSTGIQLLISDKEKLTTLKKKLIKLFDKKVFKNDRRKYFPHVTIQHGVTEFKAQQCATELAKNFTPIKATVIGFQCTTIINNKPKNATKILL